MPAGRKDIHKDGVKFGSGQDPTKGGRKPSIKNQLKEIAMSDGKVTYKADQVHSINEDGSVTIKVPKQELLAQKLWSWAMSKKGNDSIKAIQMIMEQFDGKATQEIKGDIEINLSQIKGMTIKK